MCFYSKHFSNHPEIKVGLKEVIKILEPDLDKQAKKLTQLRQKYPSFFPPRQLFLFLLFYSRLGSNIFIQSLVAPSLFFLADNKFKFLPLFHLFFVLGHGNMKKNVSNQQFIFYIIILFLYVS